LAGYDARTSGFVLGADNVVDETLLLGVAFTYADGAVKSKSVSAPQQVDTQSYQLVGYGAKALSPDMELQFQADVGVNNNEGHRVLGLTGEVAKSNYDSLSLHAGLGISKQYEVGDKTRFATTIRGDVTRIRDEAYAESGSTLLGFSSVDARIVDEFVVSFDGKVDYDVAANLTLQARGGVGYDLTNDHYAVNSAFAGAPSASFETVGIRPAAWSARAGIGLLKETQTGLEISVTYDIEQKRGYQGQSGSLKARWSF